MTDYNLIYCMGKVMLGICRICNTQCKLTKEHVPPKGAFNKKDFYISKTNPLMEKRHSTDFEELIDFDFKAATKTQGGIGFYTLCKTCNNNTGSWYGNDYIKWIQQSVDHIKQPNTLPIPKKIVSIYPLRVIKQIVSMFFSLNHAQFSQTNPSLVNYILHRDSMTLDKKIRIYAYYTEIGRVRYIANNILGDFAENKTYHLSEIAFPPIGFVMSMEGGKPDKRLTDITWFTSYKYDEQINFEQNFNLLPTYLQVICDYRTKDEIKAALKEAEQYLRD